MPLSIIRNDLVSMNTDAIVNAANTRLEQGGGVCGAIFTAAGAQDMQAACDAIGRCDTGDAVITPGFRLPARFVIHAAGPVWQGGSHGEELQLRSCYLRALALAARAGCASIAFPLLSSGIYGYPREAAFDVALSAVGTFLRDPAAAVKPGEVPLPPEAGDMQVTLVLFDSSATGVADARMTAITRYVDDHFATEVTQADIDHRLRETGSGGRKAGRMPRKASYPPQEGLDGPPQEGLAQMAEFMDAEAQPRLIEIAEHKRAYPADDRLEHLVRQPAASFAQHLLHLIDQKGMSDVDAYRRANIDRRLFSKIRSRKDYAPKKSTAVAFAIALGLDLTETGDLLARAGFALSSSSRADLIVQYCIEQGIRDINEVNRYLFHFGQPLLGA